MSASAFAIRYACREAQRQQFFHDAVAEPTARMQMDYFTWIVGVDRRIVAIDGGCTMGAADERKRDYLASPVETMKLLGAAPDDVDTVILTHLHWDHTGNLDAFGNARFVLQQREWDFWTGPYAGRGAFADLHTPGDIETLRKFADDGRVELIDGTGEIAPHLECHLVGGHTPGMQVVVVRTQGGPIVLASDAAHFAENLTQDRPFPIFVDLPGMYIAFDALRRLAEEDVNRIVPGHDPNVMRSYPSDTSPLVARLL